MKAERDMERGHKEHETNRSIVMQFFPGDKTTYSVAFWPWLGKKGGVDCTYCAGRLSPDFASQQRICSPEVAQQSACRVPCRHKQSVSSLENSPLVPSDSPFSGIGIYAPDKLALPSAVLTVAIFYE